MARIIYRKKFCPTWAEFSKSTSDQVGWKSETSHLSKLVGSLKPHICPSWTDVEKLTSTQVVSKSKITFTQLAERLDYNFYSDCVEVKFASKQKEPITQSIRN